MIRVVRKKYGEAVELLEKVQYFQNAINSLRPFEGDILGQIKDYYRVGLTVGSRPLRDVFEAVDHAKAYDHMFPLMQSRRMDEQAALHMHELFYQNIGSDDAGR